MPDEKQHVDENVTAMITHDDGTRTRISMSESIKPLWWRIWRFITFRRYHSRNTIEHLDKDWE